jgi:hypothetical protein
MVSRSRIRIYTTLVLILLIGTVSSYFWGAVVSSVAYAQEAERPTEAMPTTATPTPLARGPLQQINEHFSTQTVTYNDGTSLERIIINGPPLPPPGYELERTAVALPKSSQEMGVKTLTVPAFNWVFGCSSVSGAMIAGYYDRNGFPNMYTGPTNGGVMPLDNSSWPTWSDGFTTYPNLPLAASHQWVDGRTTRGSIDDYWIQYDSASQDPYITNGWTQHSWGDAIGDYMKTSQSAYGNTDGSTTFWNYNSATRLDCSAMPGLGIIDDGTYGRKLFYEARGYTVSDCYNQKTDNQIAGGFSFAQYKAEIDAGQPVMLNLEGHTIVGVGYDDFGSTVYIHDTWDYSDHTMPWGGIYSGRALRSVSIVNLASSLLRETEPNNDFLHANEFYLDGEKFAGQLYPESDVDVFRFMVTETGVVSFFINPENTSGAGSIRATIKDPSMNILASKELTSDSTGIYLKANVAVLGVYYYLVIDKMPAVPGGDPKPIFDKDYHVTPSIQKDPVSTAHREIEPNNPLADPFPEANDFFTTNEETYYAQLYDDSDVDYFKYSVEAPGMLSFLIKPENTSGTGSIRVTIMNSSSIILARKELASDSTGIYLEANVISGDYYLVIDKMPAVPGGDRKPIFDKDYQIIPRSQLTTGGTIIIQPYPDSINAPWTLARLSGYNHPGTGNQRIPDLTPGDYTIIWGDVSGWTKPSSATQNLAPDGTITFSGTYIQQVGSLAVTISPPGAVTAGGQWRRVSTTPWLDGGSTETGIPVGSYTVEFKTVAGWTTPSSVGVIISNGATATASGTYVQQLGSLTVMINPPGAVTAGGQWRRVGTAAWFNSGFTETAIPVGSHTVEFKTVAGWTTPSSAGVTISNGATATASGTYVQQLGSLTVMISPPGAVTAGAQWRRVGTTTWFNGGSTEAAIPVGSYTVEFKAVTGWATPSSVGVTISNGVTTAASGAYVQQPGSLTVTISSTSPQGSVSAGGQWRRVGTTTWFNSGSTENGIPYGSYTVEFKPVTGWTTPSSVGVTINNGVTVVTSGTYVRELIPIIQVTPISISFGYVPVGSTKDRSLTVKNLGGWFYLTGNATTTSPFSIVQGDYYNLGPDESKIVTVRYQPTSEGPHTGTVVFTGGSGATVQVTEKTEKPLGLPWLMLLLD